MVISLRYRLSNMCSDVRIIINI